MAHDSSPPAKPRQPEVATATRSMMNAPLPSDDSKRTRFATAGVCGFLLLAVAGIFSQTLEYGFVNYDDADYVYNNPHVMRGLTWEGVAWAFSSSKACNWHPLTWLSHMLDCQLYGLWAGGHHLTNLILHAAAAISLFLVLRKMTRDFWPSAFVAAVFAVHPLRVESVAWVAERKDVLSGLLFVLTLGAYVSYVSRPSRFRYLLVAVVFALGLLAKPMLVTLPFVLLLLDYWPLRRMASTGDKTNLPCMKGGKGPTTAANRSLQPFSQPGLQIPWSLVVEKVPLLLLSLVSCGVTVWAQQSAIAENIYVSFAARVGNAVVAYASYLIAFCCPANLVVLYPLPMSAQPGWKVAGALLILAVISVAALVARRACPYLLVGWLWYLGMLVPVIGLVQVGFQSMADRYTYLPQIGLAIAVAWGITNLSESWAHRRVACGTLSAIVLTNLMLSAWQQATYWSDSVTLWRRAIACTTRNPVAHNNLGNAMLDLGQHDDAAMEYQKAVEIDPLYADAYNHLGHLLLMAGRTDDALILFSRALALVPNSDILHNDLGNVLASRREINAALSHFHQALKSNPNCIEAHYNLATVLIGQGRRDEAIVHYQKSLDLDPDHAEARWCLGLALMQQGRLDEAAQHCQRAVDLWPNSADAHYCLAEVLRRQGKLTEALQHFQTCMKINPKNDNAQRAMDAILRQMKNEKTTVSP